MRGRGLMSLVPAWNNTAKGRLKVKETVNMHVSQKTEAAGQAGDRVGGEPGAQGHRAGGAEGVRPCGPALLLGLEGRAHAKGGRGLGGASECH